MSTTSAQPLVFYDIPNLLPDKSWSPNTWKTRYALNMKNIPYTTHWLPYREIAPEMKRIGAQPTYHAVAREHRYTLPAVFDPNTGKGIADSLAVIDYLEAAYPETVSLLPPGTRALQRSFIQVHLAPLQSSIFPLITVVCHDLVLPDYRATWREERERWTGTTLEDAAPPGEKRDAVLKNVLKILDGMDAVLSTNGGSGVFVTGDTPSYCDAVLAAVFTWMRRLLTEESADWIAVMKANDGRWHRFMNAMKKWEIVH